MMEADLPKQRTQATAHQSATRPTERRVVRAGAIWRGRWWVKELGSEVKDIR